jgi:hypothetical protein
MKYLTLAAFAFATLVFAACAHHDYGTADTSTTSTSARGYSK